MIYSVFQPINMKIFTNHVKNFRLHPQTLDFGSAA